MDILENVANDLNLRRNIVEKAKDLLRHLSLKLENGTLKKAERCRHVIALDIACFVMQESRPKEDFLKHAGIGKQDYSHAIMLCKTCLNLIKKEGILEVLGLQFNAPSLVNVANAILNQYRLNYVDKLHISQQMNINLSSLEHQTAAFFLAAKRSKMSIDKEKLFETAGINSARFKQVYDALVQRLGNAQAQYNGSSGRSAIASVHDQVRLLSRAERVMKATQVAAQSSMASIDVKENVLATRVLTSNFSLSSGRQKVPVRNVHGIMTFFHRPSEIPCN